MRRDDLCITIPSFFRCPISMDVMTSPVILSTGVTYDRASIQQWLDNGNNTCPATMQILPTQDLLPNHTLRRLILLWSTAAAAAPSLAAAPLLQPSDFLSSIASLLRRGSPEAKAAALRLLSLLSAGDGESKLALAGNNGVLDSVLALADPSSSPPPTIEAALSLLVSMTSVKRIEGSGVVRMTTAVLSSPNVTVGAVEKGLALLEMGCVGEVCREEGCVAAVVEKSLRVSAVATESAVRILWRVCCLEGEEGRKKVGRNNGVSKMLLVMQSYCSPEVRRMAGDVLKVCTRGTSSSACSYHTNTAHITPF